MKKNMNASSLDNLKPNSNGRPKGTPNKATVWKEFIAELGIDPSVAKNKIYKKVDACAGLGDAVCIKLLWDLWMPQPPKIKDEPLDIQLPPINCIEDINKAFNAIDQALNNKAITIIDAHSLANYIKTRAEVIEYKEVKHYADMMKQKQ